MATRTPAHRTAEAKRNTLGASRMVASRKRRYPWRRAWQGRGAATRGAEPFAHFSEGTGAESSSVRKVVRRLTLGIEGPAPAFRRIRCDHDGTVFDSPGCR